jgi:hypothetical protein
MASLNDVSVFVSTYDKEKSVIVNMGAGNAFEELNKVNFE